MKFSCPKCNTRYSVADEKVPQNRTLRFTCKKCDNVFRLRRRTKPTAMQTGSQAQQPRNTSGSTVVPLARMPGGETTRVAKIDEILNIRERSRESAPTPAAPFIEHGEWFVLIQGKQDGPLTANQVLKMFSDGKIDKRTYAWREGMADWLRLEVVGEFEDIADKADDASWRVIKPLEEPMERPAALENTVSMNVSALNRELQRLRTEEGAGQSEAGAQSSMGATMVRARPTGEVPTVQGPANGAAVRPARSKDIDVPAAFDEVKPADDGSGVSGVRSAELDGGGAESFNKDYTNPGILASLVDGEGPALRDDLDDGFDPFQATQELRRLDHPAPRRGTAPLEPLELGADAPIGEATRVFMATAGIFKRRRRQRFAAVLGSVMFLLLAVAVVADVTGTFEIPGMGAVYAGLDIEDTNEVRAKKRIETKLAHTTLTAAEKQALRDKLLGIEAKIESKSKGRRVRRSKQEVPTEEGVVDTKTSDSSERDFLRQMQDDGRKTERRLKAPVVRRIETPPDLPAGLTGEVLKEEINRNSSAIKLCITEAMRAGEPPKGRMEVAITIHADGKVRGASIESDKFKGSTVGQCTVRYVKRWRFPRFNGKPVNVVFPYVFN